MKKSWIINGVMVVTYGWMMVANVLANALPLYGVTTGQVSDRYFNLFAPIGLTFSIWGLIYLLLFLYIVTVVSTVYSPLNQRKRDSVNLLFALSSFANGLWIFAWHRYSIFLSVLLMLIILGCLAAISILIKHEKGLIKATFGIYFGWITVATIANITIFLVSIRGYTNVAMNLQTVLILFIGLLIASLTIYRQKDLYYGSVIVWAYLGIYLKHINHNAFDRGYPSIIQATLISIVVLILVMLLTAIKKKPLLNR